MIITRTQAFHLMQYQLHFMGTVSAKQAWYEDGPNSWQRRQYRECQANAIGFASV